jgi:short-subunit dehydrogenase
MHVAVTGASSGIGEAIAREYAAAGADVTLVARRRPLLEKLAGELRARTAVVEHDLSDPARAADWIAAAEAKLGPIDVLVNNAGMQIIGPTAEANVDSADALLRTNLLTPLRLVRAVLPAMLARQHGAIVNIASLAALAPTPGMTWYNASKGGLAAASESLRGELLSSGVHVVTVYPGIVDSAMARAGLDAYEQSRALALQPRGTPDELARLVRRAVDRRHARVIYPRVYHAARWMPAVTRWVLDHFTPPLVRK